MTYFRTINTIFKPNQTKQNKKTQSPYKLIDYNQDLLNSTDGKLKSHDALWVITL